MDCCQIDQNISVLLFDTLTERWKKIINIVGFDKIGQT